MKINRILSLAACAVFIPLMSSCLMDQKDVFEEDSAARMSSYLANVQNVLKANETWIMYYYPHQKQVYGGTVNFLSFTDKEVTTAGEVSNLVLGKTSSYTETSLYKLTADNGPVLSFDTRNSIIQYWGAPSGSGSKNTYGESGLYQGHRGDFEFIVISATKDEIVLKGKRTGSYAYMYPFEGDYAEYLDNIEEVKKSFVISKHTGTVGSVEVNGQISFEDRQLYFDYTDGKSQKEITAPFLFTDSGIRFYKPVTLGGQTVSGYTFDKTSFAFTATDGANSSLQGVLPENWHAYEDFLGEFEFEYAKGKFDVTIEQGVYRKTLLVKGLNDKYDVVLDYNLNEGIVSLSAQKLATTDDGYDLWMLGWDSKAGYVSYLSTVGMNGTNGTTEEGKLKVTFSDNSAWKTYTAYGFLLRLIVKDQTPASGSNKGNASSSTYKSWWFAGATNHQVADIKSIVKK